MYRVTRTMHTNTNLFHIAPTCKDINLVFALHNTEMTIVGFIYIYILKNFMHSTKWHGTENQHMYTQFSLLGLYEIFDRKLRMMKELIS